MQDSGFRAGRQESTTIWTSEAQGGVLLSAFEGRIVFANGLQGRCAGVETIDLTDDDAFRGTLIVTLPDGSVCRQAFAGRTLGRRSEAELHGDGSWSVMEASGRFHGLSGGGIFQWQLDRVAYVATFAG